MTSRDGNICGPDGWAMRGSAKFSSVNQSSNSTTKLPHSVQRHPVPSLTVLGRDAELDGYLDGDHEQTPSYLIAQKHRQLSRSALRFNTPLPSILTLGNQMDEIQQRCPSPLPAPVPDLLGSILTGQEVLMTPSSSVSIRRGGTLHVKRPNCQYTSSSSQLYNGTSKPKSNIAFTNGSEKKENEKLNLKNERINFLNCANSPEETEAGKSSSKPDNTSSSKRITSSSSHHSVASNGERHSSSTVSSHSVNDSGDVGHHSIDDNADGDLPQIPTVKNSTQKRIKLKRFNLMGPNLNVEPDPHGSGKKTGRKIQIKKVLNLPHNKQKKIEKKSSEDVYDPFDPTEDDEEEQNNGVTVDIYDPFEPTLSDEEKEEAQENSSFSTFSKFTSHETKHVDEESQPVIKVKEENDDTKPPKSHSKSVEKEDSVFTDFELDELLDSNLDAAKPPTRQSLKQSNKPVKQAASPEFDMFAEPETLGADEDKSSNIFPSTHTDPSSAWRKKVRSLSNSQDTAVVKLPGFSSGISDSTPVQFKKFKVKKSVETVENVDDVSTVVSATAEDNIQKIEKVDGPEKNEENIPTLVEAEEESKITETGTTEERIVEESAVAETKKDKKSSKDSLGRHERSRSRSLGRRHQEKSDKTKHRSHRHSSSYSRGKSSMSRSDGRHRSGSGGRHRSQSGGRHRSASGERHESGSGGRHKSGSGGRHRSGSGGRHKSGTDGKSRSRSGVRHRSGSGGRHRSRSDSRNRNRSSSHKIKHKQRSRTPSQHRIRNDRSHKSHHRQSKSPVQKKFSRDTGDDKDESVSKIKKELYSHPVDSNKEKKHRHHSSGNDPDDQMNVKHMSSDNLEDEVVTAKMKHRGNKKQKKKKKQLEDENELVEEVELKKELSPVRYEENEVTNVKKKRSKDRYHHDSQHENEETNDRVKNPKTKNRQRHSKNDVHVIVDDSMYENEMLKEDIKERDSSKSKSSKKKKRRSERAIKEKFKVKESKRKEDLDYTESDYTDRENELEQHDEDFYNDAKQSIAKSHTSKKMRNNKTRGSQLKYPDDQSHISSQRKKHEKKTARQSPVQISENEFDNKESSILYSRKSKKKPRKASDSPTMITVENIAETKEFFSSEELEDNHKKESTKRHKSHKKRKLQKDVFDEEVLPAKIFKKKKKRKEKEFEEEFEDNVKVKLKKKKQKQKVAEAQSYDEEIHLEKRSKKKRSSFKEHNSDDIKPKKRRHRSPTPSYEDETLKEDELQFDKEKIKKRKKKKSKHQIDDDPSEVKHVDLTRMLSSHELNSDCLSPLRTPTPPKKETMSISNKEERLVQDLEENDQESVQPSTKAKDSGDEIYSPFEALAQFEEETEQNVGRPVLPTDGNEIYSPTEAILNDGSAEVTSPLNTEFPSAKVEEDKKSDTSTPLRDERSSPGANVAGELPTTNLRSPSPMSPSSLSPESYPVSPEPQSSQEIKETLSYAEEFLEQSRKRWEERKKTPGIASSFMVGGPKKISSFDVEKSASHSKVQNQDDNKLLIPIINNSSIATDNLSNVVDESKTTEPNFHLQNNPSNETPVTPIVSEDIFADSPVVLEKTSDKATEKESLKTESQQGEDSKNKSQEITEVLKNTNVTDHSVENVIEPDHLKQDKETDISDIRKDLGIDESLWTKDVDERIEHLHKPHSPGLKRQSRNRSKSRSPRRRRSRSREREREKKEQRKLKSSESRSRRSGRRSHSPYSSRRKHSSSPHKRFQRERDRKTPERRRRSRSRDRSKRSRSRSRTRNESNRRGEKLSSRTKSPVRSKRKSRSPQRISAFKSAAESTIFSVKRRESQTEDTGPRPIATISGRLTANHHAMQDHHHELEDEDFIPKSLIPKSNQSSILRTLVEIPTNETAWNSSKTSALIQINTAPDTNLKSMEQTSTSSNRTLINLSSEKESSNSLDDKLAKISAGLKQDTRIVIGKENEVSENKPDPSAVTSSTPTPPPPPPPLHITSENKPVETKIPGLSLFSDSSEHETDAYSPTDTLGDGSESKTKSSDKAKKTVSSPKDKLEEEKSVLNPTQILNFIGLNPQQKSAAQNAILSIAELSKHLQLDKLMKSDKKQKSHVKEDDGLSPVSIDNIESSAVEMYNKGKETGLLKKLQFQERVVEEAKLAIKPYYERREIDKYEYKEIMKRAVNKICSSESNLEVNNIKIRRLIRRYIEKYQHKSTYKKEKMRSKLDEKIKKPSKAMDSPDRPSYEPLTPPHQPGPKQPGDGINKTVNPPSLLKREPRKIVTLPDLPLPPPPPPPRPSYMP
uniref:serine/arginine repetitive matrix protein 2-like n=1 Tax=Styela clava TaxID=7725 RepID=UPI00193A1CDF|nr:serine/arginine repetitive matrix protein 2-like [Styela clava]